MGILTKTTAADLRQRAESAEQAAAEADRRAGAARAEAASCLADGDAEGARRARSRAIELATEAETQRDLAAELHRRADETAKAERLAAYEAQRRDAAKAAADAERLMRTVLVDIGEKLSAAQAVHREAMAKCWAASRAFDELSQEAGVKPPPSAFDPFLSNGLFSARFAELPVWQITEAR